tara:strand:- start:370 stop:789 length:420 start_codon:yes stop_codon:yes gene_type:complete
MQRASQRMKDTYNQYLAEEMRDAMDALSTEYEMELTDVTEVIHEEEPDSILAKTFRDYYDYRLANFKRGNPKPEDGLPEELVQHIADFLDDKSVGNLARTSVENREALLDVSARNTEARLREFELDEELMRRFDNLTAE